MTVGLSIGLSRAIPGLLRITAAFTATSAPSYAKQEQPRVLLLSALFSHLPVLAQLQRVARVSVALLDRSPTPIADDQQAAVYWDEICLRQLDLAFSLVALFSF